MLTVGNARREWDRPGHEGDNGKRFAITHSLFHGLTDEDVGAPGGNGKNFGFSGAFRPRDIRADRA